MPQEGKDEKFSYLYSCYANFYGKTINPILFKKGKRKIFSQ